MNRIVRSARQPKIKLKGSEMSRAIDLRGQKFNRLKVIDRNYNVKRRGTVWNCKCDCGNITFVVADKLKSGNTKSCGCLQKEKAGEFNKSKGLTKHGLSDTAEYKSWLRMNHRCNRDDVGDLTTYKNIEVCDKWHQNNKNGFINFLNDMGYKPDEGATLERLNSKSGYYPDNCIWTNYSNQAQNRSSNVFNKDQIPEIRDLYENKKLTISEISKLYNCSQGATWKVVHYKSWE